MEVSNATLGQDRLKLFEAFKIGDANEFIKQATSHRHFFNSEIHFSHVVLN